MWTRAARRFRAASASRRGLHSASASASAARPGLSLAARLGLGAAAGFGAAAAYAAVDAGRAERALDACGIVAYVGNEEALPYLLEGLTILQNRGYDSAGVTTFREDEAAASPGKGAANGRLVTTKHASKGSTSDSIELVRESAPERHKGDSTGIAHTRWATHGGKTDSNAHPHLDYKERVALVHNGTIENADALRDELRAAGIPFSSETDTEVVVQLIGHHLDAGMSLVEATEAAVKRLEGTWGIVAMSAAEPDRLIAARNGSPLVVGVGKDRMFVASETTAFQRHCTDFVALKDGEVAVVSRGDHGTIDLSRVEKAQAEDIPMSPEPFPHWTIKEIMEQPQAVSRTLNYGGRFTQEGHVRLGGLDSHKGLLLGIKHLLLSGCGTSLYASMYGAMMMRSLGAFDSAHAVDASETFSDAFPRGDGGLLVVSQSGETKDVHRTLGLARQAGVPQFSIVNAVGSLIARTTRCGVYLYAGREQAVASTKAFTTQVTAMALVAGWFAQNRGGTSQQARERLMDAVHCLPTYVGMTLRTRPQMRRIAERLQSAEHMFVLGKGYSMPIAMEAALKIKEITYVHAEGYGGGALKHGPFALLENNLPVVMIIPDDEHAELMRIAAAQVKGRGAYTIVITDRPELAEGVADEVVSIPSNGPLTALLAVVPLQLLAYELSVAKGIDPDKPKNLAKAVTVD